MPASLLVLVGVIAAIEALLSLADAGWIADPTLRSRVILAGGFWPGLLHGARPLFAAQPFTMFLTHAFLHASMLHMAMNMTILLALGRFVADRYGARSVLPIFVASAIAGGAVFGLLVRAAFPMVGASGAVFGFLGVWIAWDWRRHQRAGRATTPVLRRILVLVGINLVMLYWPALMSSGPTAGLAWQAHLGGFLAGLLIGWGLEGRIERAGLDAARRRRVERDSPDGPGPR